MSPRINTSGVSNRYEDDWSQEDYDNLKRRSDLSPVDLERLEAYEEAGYEPSSSADSSDDSETSEGGATSPGSSSSTSSSKTEKSEESEPKDLQSPVRTTGASSKKDQADSSTARSTDGSGKANR